ncbi:hypothetical protein [Aquibacillus sediminis]|uniref:hypothetical protein n=1 Tax=Aquibacillus sediminis TaxID=2574734 RepID=UPI001107FE59|nr:hypothetical protein [Aquibacillus sediminis]
MKIFGSIHQRARKYLIATIKLFHIKLDQVGALAFKEKNSNQEAKWRFEYRLTKSFISKIYKLHASYTFPIHTNREDFSISWDYRNKQWKSEGGNSDYLKFLNKHQIVKKIILSMDFETVKIKQEQGKCIVTLVPIPGSFVFMLFPPMQYFLKIKENEVELMKQLANRVQVITDNFYYEEDSDRVEVFSH